MSSSSPFNVFQSTEEHLAATLSQVEEQSRDSSNTNQEQAVATMTPISVERSTVSFPPGKEASTMTSLLQPQGPTLTTIATELRLKIYDHLFQTPVYHLLRRRAGADDEIVIEKLAHPFDGSLLFTCRKIYEEALPVFYANHTFHYSSSDGGYTGNNSHLMVHLSIDSETEDMASAYAALFKLVTGFTQHWPHLRTLTVRLLIGDYPSQSVDDSPADSSNGIVCRQKLVAAWVRDGGKSRNGWRKEDDTSYIFDPSQLSAWVRNGGKGSDGWDEEERYILYC